MSYLKETKRSKVNVQMMLWFKWHDGPLTGLVEQRAHAKLPSTSPPPFDSFLSCHQRADLFFLCFSGLQTRLLSFSTILTYQMLCLLLLPFSPTTFWHPRPWFPQWKWHAFNYMLGLACSMAIAHKSRSFLSNRMELLRYDPPTQWWGYMADNAMLQITIRTWAWMHLSIF